MSDILTIILSPDLQQTLLPLRILFLLVGIFFLGFIIFFLFNTRWLKLRFGYDFVEFFTLRMYGSISAARRWQKIKKKATKMRESDFNHIVVESHDILDKLLKRLVPLYQANSFGERLARIGEGTLSNIKDVWEAHELYRSVTREPNFAVKKEELIKMLETYERAFKELEVI
jgi:hypothetical protein